ncbi:TIGR03086 family protein [Pseudonocardia sp. CNS-004]|nr:TIGR03086 family protein [Pseudonocardia sp. CNS-004]
MDDLETVLRTVGDLVATVPAHRWEAPTPCPDWNARELVEHLVLGHQLFAGILRGTAVVTPDALDPARRDVLGDDPTGTYRAATDDLLAAFRQPGALDQVVEVPFGVVPGIVAVHLRAVEELVHGWDLATAGGRTVRFPDDVVERALGFTRAALADVPPDRSPFAPAQPVSARAPALDRLVALVGRSPDSVTAS